MTFNDDGYEWHETTTQEDLARGRRVLVRGRRLDRVTELVHGIEALIGELGNYEAIAAPEITLKLRALL